MSPDPAASAAETSRILGGDRYRWLRKFKDRFAAVAITGGGFSVLVAILLIFVYLLYEVLPLFRSASVTPVASYSVTQIDSGLDARAAPPLYLAIEEQNEIGMRLDHAGHIVFFHTADGSLIERLELPIPTGRRITSFAIDTEHNHLLALGLSDGSALLVRHNYSAKYAADGSRRIVPELVYPYGQKPLMLEAGAPIQSLAVRDIDAGLMLVAAVDGHLLARKWEKQEDFLSGEKVITEVPLAMPVMDIAPASLLIGPNQQWLYALAADGNYRVIDLNNGTLADSGRLFTSGKLRDARFLLGGISIMVASDQGEIGQWFMVRKPGAAPQLTRIRTFADNDGTGITLMAAEHRRKGFAAVDAKQRLHIFYATSERHLLTTDLGAEPVLALALSPRANALVYEDGSGTLHFQEVSNPHPEVSWSALWNKVWYENYSEPEYVWQSSSASDEFEPKYGLTPLAFGTLKAAFYAMIVAAPLAICGAIFTAYFMAPALRRKVKPLIELMAALPTVILGFLAGLWLAPVVERHLPGIFAVLILMPLAVLVFAYAWNQLPMSLRKWIPDGWQPLLLAPVILGIIAVCFGMSGVVERAFFGGDMRLWMHNEWGTDYAQRNAVVVGIAMGFAVIPNIFSIAEDAIFSVPKQLSYGSLALGATLWQTLVGVVLPTASPGIFSALMIGLGRAVGETMIVLMAAGNTPIMDANIFQGMRTLSANIAVEIGETAINSTHFRVLFLAAFVLFMFTFVLNTLAEIIRQRLRRRYSVI